jgi:hypothetical protein
VRRLHRIGARHADWVRGGAGLVVRVLSGADGVLDGDGGTGVVQGGGVRALVWFC